MRDLREIYAGIEVKVADPVVPFCETVIETSTCKCFAETPNKRNKLQIICRPLEKKLADDIQLGFTTLESIKTEHNDQDRKYFQLHDSWDLLSTRRIWVFGPESQNP